jgi:D-alanine-D-alanine ligase
MNIWLIMGGMSSEREVSLESGRAVASALIEGGHRVFAYELGAGAFMPEHSSAASDLPARPLVEGAWSERLLATGRWIRGRAEVAFLALHGDEGENGTIQALLESIRFPYTGSGPSACAITMDKALTKRVMESLGVPTPRWTLLEPPAGVELDPKRLPPVPALYGAGGSRLPIVVKPNAEGSSVGVSIVRAPEEWGPAIEEALRPLRTKGDRKPQLLIEEYIPGRELTVGVLDGEALPVVEMVPRTGFYDYARKYTAGETIYNVPADLPAEEATKLQNQALSIYNATGCYGMARVDFRMDPGSPAKCLEVNTIPGLTSTSLLPKAAGAVGISFLGLLERVCQAALRSSPAGSVAGSAGESVARHR